MEKLEPKKRLVKRAGGIIEDDIQTAINEGVRLAFIAYDSPDSCKSAAINLAARGCLLTWLICQTYVISLRPV